MAIFQFIVSPLEHVYLHHRWVGTQNDPNTSPKGQSLYSCTVKVKGHAFVFKRSKLAFLGCLALELTYPAIIFAVTFKHIGSIDNAISRTGFFLAIGLASYCFFEVVEYIEHDGLVYRSIWIRRLSEKAHPGIILLTYSITSLSLGFSDHLNAYKSYTA